MKNKFSLPFLLLLALFLSNIISTSAKEKLVKYVNPFIGTGGHGHTYPGATVPYGMVQLSPDNGRGGWDWCSGYNYSDSLIIGFSHTHLSGTGCGDLCDVLITPTTGKFNLDNNIMIDSTFNLRSKFSHKNEKAEPGYYSVLLDDYNIKAELTATERAGFHKYTFPESLNSSIVIDLGYSVNWDSPTKTNITVENKTTISGYRFSTGWAKDQKVFFVIEFSKPFSKYALGSGEELFINNNKSSGKYVKGIFGYTTKKDETVFVKVGISYVSIENAKLNLKKEIPGWSFDKVKERARLLWEKELEKIIINTKKTEDKVTFYTAVYHSKIAPIIFSDVNGQYRGGDGQVHAAKDFTNYSIFSLWDTYRAVHPLFTISNSERVSDMVKSMLAFYNETGALPNWPLVANETNIMIGIHAVPVIAEAYLKGIRNFDIEKAYSAMKNSLIQDNFGLKFYRDYKYIPSDKENESVSKTLEYAFDDWCLAQVAKALGKHDDYKLFSERAGYYKNVFDPSSGFMRGRLADGSWKSPFDPLFNKHRDNEYVEANGWQYFWFVPQDVKGLINLTGGKEKFICKLDSLFNLSEKIKGAELSPDISGLIGQYAHGNEPCHHVAYLYNYAGAAWKTQEKVRRIMDIMYNSTPEGLCGNEDCGQMSAWYVLSSAGLYPVNPASGVYIIGSPKFDEIKILVEKGKYFTIKAKNNSSKNIYIKSARLNGNKLDKSYILHSDLLKGGTLEFEMSNTPNKEWGSVDSSLPED